MPGWLVESVVGLWTTLFHQQMEPLVAAEHARQRMSQARGAGRPKKCVVTGYLIDDDSTMQKIRGKKREGLDGAD